MKDSCEHDNEPSGSIKCSNNSGLAEQLTASQEGASSMELVKNNNNNNNNI
jgi:hypothetical protein